MLKYKCIHKVGDKMSETKIYNTKDIEEAAISEVIKEVAEILAREGFTTIEEVFERMPTMDKPLALYYFGESPALKERIENELAFGGGCFNDTVMHLANEGLPFGGFGDSGMGAYHGEHSFALFSHHKSILDQSTRIDVPVRYPPYLDWKQKVMRLLLKL